MIDGAIKRTISATVRPYSNRTRKSGKISTVDLRKRHYSVASKPARLPGPPKILPSWIPFFRHVNVIVCVILLLGIVSLITATLVVGFTSPKSNRKQCTLEFNSVVDNMVGLDSQPRSVAVADFNNDTWLDLAVAYRGNDVIGIFLGYGNGTFSSQNTYSSGSNSDPYSIAVGDFNNDRKADIAVANYETNSICVLFGKGDGSFGNQRNFSVNSSRPIFITVGDFNQDNCLDIVIASPSTDNIAILLGDGNGYFAMQITYSTGYDSLPYSITANDFNNDSYLDIAVANFGTNTVALFLGFKNETFMSELMFPTGVGSAPCSITVGDFNQDNQLDIVVANSGTGTIGILFGYGDGTFENQKIYLLGNKSQPFFIAVGDFNDDYYLDIAVSDKSTYNISIFLGGRNGILETPITHLISSRSSSSGIATGYFDNDHQSDIAIANADTNDIVILTKFATEPSKYPQTYSTGDGSTPYQVLISDFNNDQKLDVVVVNVNANNIGVFLGHANGSFENRSMYSTGNLSGPTALALGDFNNDQRLDIVTCNNYGNSLGIFLGYGNGSFASVITYFVYDYFSPMSVVVDDFNRDGIQDLAVVSYGPNTLNILTGFGNGTFELFVTYSTGDGSSPYSVAAADLNNDQKLDIVVANRGTDNIGIFLGYGDGSFGFLSIFSSGHSSGPTSVCINDFNNDQQLDILVSNYYSSNIGIFLGYGNGTFRTLTTYSTEPKSNPYGLTAGDLNDDSCQDIVVANSNLNTIDVLLGYCNGTFASYLSFPTGPNSSPYSVAIGDLNNDHRLDIVSANNEGNSITILLGHETANSKNLKIDTKGPVLASHSVRLDNGSNTIYEVNNLPTLLLGDYYSDFQSEIVYSTGSGSHPYSIVLGDFNNDSLLDMAIANSGYGNVAILFGYGNGSFTSEKTYSTGSSSHPQYLIAIDINESEVLTIIGTNPIQDSLFVFYGEGNGTFKFERTVMTGYGSSPSSIVAGNFNQDSYLDLVVANPGTDSLGIFLGYHYATFQTATIYSTGKLSYPNDIAIGDLNSDNQLDIVIAGYSTNNIGVQLGYGNGTFSSQIVYDLLVGSHPYSIALGDFNNDDNLDIATANWVSNSISVLLGYGNGTFTQAKYYDTGIATRPSGIAVGDLNHDNCLDIVTSNYVRDSVSVFLGYGNGTFRKFVMYSIGNLCRPKWVILYDLNRDNHLDIISCNQASNDLGIFYGCGDGTFTNVSLFYISNDCAPTYNTIADLNSDGQPDIIVACHHTGNIGIFFGHSNGTFEPITVYATSLGSGVNSIVIGDFNDDNQLDIATTNSYNGYIDIFFAYDKGQFLSSVPYPSDVDASVFALGSGDFNNDGKLDIAYVDTTNSELGILIWSGIEHFGGQRSLSMPQGSKPISVAVGNFNNDEWLDIVTANHGADNIALLFGTENANFDNMKLYSTGDGSTPISVVVNDINNDSLSDIIATNYGTGNIIIFYGDGNGTFPTASKHSTGIDSGPTSTAISDFNLDGHLDIIVANSVSNIVLILLGGVNGTFRNRVKYSLDYTSNANYVVLGDFDGDKVPDIVVADNATDEVLILLKQC